MSGSESIGKIPKEWEVVKLQDVTLKAKSLDASTLSEFDYVDISSIDNQTFKITNWARLKGKQAPSRARRLIRKDDVLFATTRPYLKNIAIV
ncbi:MAG: restriction endonuclease subunit S, partial [Deltaproteobacteria bacterium]